MSTPSCVESAWKQQLNSCTTDYCRGWTKTHFLSCCFAQESPLRHVVMTSTTNPPHESGAFQFSLTFQRRGFARPCRPAVTRFWFWFDSTLHGVHTQEENEAMERWVHTHTHTDTHTREITAGGHGCLELRALALPPPAPIPLSHRVPGGQRDHDFLLHPVLCWRKGHLSASPAAEHRWHTWTSLTHWPLSQRSWHEDRNSFAWISKGCMNYSTNQAFNQQKNNCSLYW